MDILTLIMMLVGIILIISCSYILIKALLVYRNFSALVAVLIAVVGSYAVWNTFL